MIRLRNVEKHYQTGHVKTFVLRRVDVDIEEGEFVTVMGPSGAGKSTLMSIVGMLDAAWEGEYYFLLLSSIFGMVVMASSRDLISIFIALETLSIPARRDSS